MAKDTELKGNREANELRIPFTVDSDGNPVPYDVNSCNKSQKEIILLILKKLQEYVQFKASDDSSKKFEPLRMTIMGQAGTGKSYLINTLVSITRTMFQDNDVIVTTGPTGAAANNVNGKTMHSMFGINFKNPKNQMSQTVRKRLMKQLRRTLVLVMDERSMISSETLGASARNCSETAHGGVHGDLSWGGIPVVLLVGDDHQLPPVETDGGKGAFYILTGKDNCVNSNWGSNIETLGVSQFLALSKTVKLLSKIERQNEQDTDHTSLLDALRPPKQLSKTQVKRLLNLDTKLLPESTRNDIIWNSMHLYANKDKAREWNNINIIVNSGETNPVAMIRAKGESAVSKNGKAILSHYSTDQTPVSTNLFVNAKVAINGPNFYPEWGLFNGAIGTVEEIVYQDGDNPNDKDLPLYVAVKFENYEGPIWDPQNPKTVPIPVIDIPCGKERQCCKLRTIPLVPAYATTIHKFQGQSAGPTRKGQRPNEVQRIVCCPGSRKFEALNPGTLYTLLTRATTLGAYDGTNSALYFIGDNINADRFTNIHLTREGKVFEKVKRRDKWIAHLKRSIQASTVMANEVSTLIKWAQSVRYSKDFLDSAIDVVSNNFMEGR